MSIQNKIIKKIDLPVYEFLRPHPITAGTAANQTFVFSHDGKDQIGFGVRSGTLYRYDIATDSWLTVGGLPQTTDNRTATVMSPKGYVGQVNSATLSSVFIPMYNGTATAIGKTIRIIQGPGKNQERTITNVLDPVPVGLVAVTTATNNAGTNAGTIFVTDTTLTLSANEFKGCEIKFIGNTTGYGQVRPIIYHTNQTIHMADPTLQGVLPHCMPANFTSLGTNQIGVIQRTEVLIDSNWDVLPTSDSLFEILDTGKVYMINNTNSPFSFFEYDRFSNSFFYQSIASNFYTALGTDWTLESTYLSETPLVSSAITSASLNTFSDTLCGVNPLLRNYVVKITSGTGKGQIRNILSAGQVSYVIDRQWDVVPDNTSLYQIQNQSKSLYFIANAHANIIKYDTDLDVWTRSAQVADHGVITTMYATNSAISGYGGIPIFSLSNVGTRATITTVRPHLINGPTVMTIDGAASAPFNGTFLVTPSQSNATQFSYDMLSVPANTNAAVTNSTSVVYDTTKNWIPNQWAGFFVQVQTNSSPTGSPTNQNVSYFMRGIASNTSNSITFGAGGSLSQNLLNGNRYQILPPLTMGRDITEGDTPSKSGYGNTTTNGTTTLTDSTKNWKTNIYVNKRLLLPAAGSAGSEINITANTATTLTLGGAGLSHQSSQPYVILNSIPNAGGCSLKFASNTSKDKGRYIYYHPGGNSIMFPIKYDIARETFESVLYFNPTTSTGTTNTGQCAGYDYKDRLYFNLGANTRDIYYIDLASENIMHAGLYPYNSANNNYTNMRHIGLLNVDNIKFLYYMRAGNTSDWYRHMIVF
jgi:hypothetical protein